MTGRARAGFYADACATVAGSCEVAPAGRGDLADGHGRAGVGVDAVGTRPSRRACELRRPEPAIVAAGRGDVIGMPDGALARAYGLASSLFADPFSVQRAACCPTSSTSP